MHLGVLIMAAGMGTRMKSKLPKVLHLLLGKPLLTYPIDAVKSLEPVEIVVIVGHEADQIKAHLTNEQTQVNQSLSFATQSPQLGTGHAVQQAQSLLQDKADAVLVIYGDMPLITLRTLNQLVESYQSNQPAFVLLTVEADDPRGFGRIVRDDKGYVIAIVEEADCTPEQKAIRELNVGVYLFKADWLWKNLKKIPLSAKGEYYLTDLVNVAVQQGQPVQAEVLTDPLEAIGINNRIHLADAEAALRHRINRKWMEAGVTMIDPSTTYVGWDVTLKTDTVIYPNTYIYGTTIIGSDCIIGPNSFVVDSIIGNGCKIRFSVIEEANLEDNVDIGPFVHLRSVARLAEGIH